MKADKVVIQGTGLSTLLDRWRDTVNPVYYHEAENLHILMHESSYFRIESNLLSVLIFRFPVHDTCEIEIVTGGGRGELELDWGAESKENRIIVRSLSEICRLNSWQITGENVERYTRDTALDKLGKLFFGKGFKFWQTYDETVGRHKGETVLDRLGRFFFGKDYKP